MLLGRSLNENILAKLDNLEDLSTDKIIELGANLEFGRDRTEMILNDSCSFVEKINFLKGRFKKDYQSIYEGDYLVWLDFASILFKASEIATINDELRKAEAPKKHVCGENCSFDPTCPAYGAR